MNKIVKRLYQIPLVKVVSFKVEEGFQASLKNLRVGIQDDDPEIERQGTEAFGFTHF